MIEERTSIAPDADRREDARDLQAAKSRDDRITAEVEMIEAALKRIREAIASGRN